MDSTLKYNKMLMRIKRWADLEVSREELVKIANGTDQYSGAPGNEHSDGARSAEASHALECRDLLREIGELGNEALN